MKHHLEYVTSNGSRGCSAAPRAKRAESSNEGMESKGAAKENETVFAEMERVEPIFWDDTGHFVECFGETCLSY